MTVRNYATLVREDGTVIELVESRALPPIVVISRFMARRVARQLNEERATPYLRFEVERRGLLRWAVVATAAARP
jgi:hypothetical protein